MKHTLLLLLFSYAACGQTKPLSILELLEHKQQYTGKTITVKGYYYDEFENRAIYYKKKSPIAKSIWLDSFDKKIIFQNAKGKQIDQSELNRKVVYVTGLFKYSSDTIAGRIYGVGHMGGWKGELVNISSIIEK
jgi:hypothetical protein